MWLTPYWSSTSRVRSATPWSTRASAAAPNRVRVLSCPVLPNGAVGIAILSLLRNRPGLLAVAHVPEHPLVAARRLEVVGEAAPLGLADALAHPVGDPEHGVHDLPEVLAAVRLDPAPVEGVRRPLLQQRLAHLPVDPVAGEHGPERLGP